MADILIIDNDPTIRETFGMMLQVADHTVREASSWDEALEQMKDALPDLILLDLLMSDGSGSDLIHVLNQRFGRDNIPPCVVVSGAATAKRRNELVVLGAHAVLEKPIEIDDLLSAVASALKN